MVKKHRNITNSPNADSVQIVFRRSNCDGRLGNQLREHYKRPYFLPPDSNSSQTDWIFMGSPGHGAQMHVGLFRAIFAAHVFAPFFLFLISRHQ